MGRLLGMAGDQMVFVVVDTVRTTNCRAVRVDPGLIQVDVYGSLGEGIDVQVLIGQVGKGTKRRSDDHYHCAQGQKQCLGLVFIGKTSFSINAGSLTALPLHFFEKQETLPFSKRKTAVIPTAALFSIF